MYQLISQNHSGEKQGKVHSPQSDCLLHEPDYIAICNK